MREAGEIEHLGQFAGISRTGLVTVKSQVGKGLMRIGRPDRRGVRAGRSEMVKEWPAKGISA